MEIILILPFPPSVNNYYIASKLGVYKTAKGRDYSKAVLSSIREQLPGVQFTDNLHVEVTIYPPDRRKRDLDNYMKSLLDSITEAELWEDDSLIDQLDIRRGLILPKGLAVVEINPAGPKIPLPSWITSRQLRTG